MKTAGKQNAAAAVNVGKLTVMKGTAGRKIVVAETADPENGSVRLGWKADIGLDVRQPS